MQSLLDKTILATRYVLVVFYIGLGIALVAYAIRFGQKVWKFANEALTSTNDAQLLLGMLYLVDSALVASLVAMVAISSYDSLVSRLQDATGKAKIDWVSNLDPGNLKLKVGIAIIAISSIHLLQKFMDIASLSDRDLAWGVGIHMTFVAGALVLGLLDRMQTQTEMMAKLGNGKDDG